MNNRIKNRSKKSSKKQLQNIARLVDDNQELEKKYEQVSSKNESLKKEIQNLKHDLRNPLYGITGLLDLIIEDKDQFEVHSSDLIIIKESAQSIIDLVNSSLVTDPAEKALKENMSVDRLLTSAMMEINCLYLPMAKNKGISLSLRTQIHSEIPLTPNFYIDLIQVTGNLVANAIKFTPSNGSVDVVFTLDANGNQSTLNMTVTDNGKSMSPDQVSAFNQGKPVAGSTGTNGEKGTGTGLQHVRNIVSKLNGRAFVESQKDSGTTFSLSFPLSNQNLPLKITTHYIIKNGTVSHNGHHS